MSNFLQVEKFSVLTYFPTNESLKYLILPNETRISEADEPAVLLTEREVHTYNLSSLSIKFLAFQFC